MTARRRSEQVADYFTQDLYLLVKRARIDLASEFQVPPEYSRDLEDIVELIRQDIMHMLDDGLIDGMRLILSDSEMDKGTNAYAVRYQVRYQVDVSTLDPTIMSNGDAMGSGFGPPGRIWHNARFTLLIDWLPSAHNVLNQVRRPNYHFDWVTEENYFDATNLFSLNRPGVVLDGTDEIVTRDEFTPFEHLPDV